MTAEFPKASDQSPEEILAQHEERFGELRGEIMESLRPQSALMIACSEGEDPMGDEHLSVDKMGKWYVGFGRDGIKTLGEVGFRDVLQNYAVASARNVLITGEEDIINKLRLVKESAIKNVESNPAPFAIRLLGRMEQALKTYKENPY